MSLTSLRESYVPHKILQWPRRSIVVITPFSTVDGDIIGHNKTRYLGRIICGTNATASPRTANETFAQRRRSLPRTSNQGPPFFTKKFRSEIKRCTCMTHWRNDWALGYVRIKGSAYNQSQRSWMVKVVALDQKCQHILWGQKPHGLTPSTATIINVRK